MENTIDNAEKFIDELIIKHKQPMNSMTRLFWSEVLYEYGNKLLQHDVSKSVDSKIYEREKTRRDSCV